MKRFFWFVFDGALALLGSTVGRAWRWAVRPRSGAIVDHLRLLRIILWFHRFDAFGTHCAIGRGVRIWGSVRVFLGERCALFDDVIINGVGTLTIGDRSTIGHNSVIVCRERVEIGSNVMIAAFCYILDVDHEFESTEIPVSRQGLRVHPVTIGNDVWVGAQSIILRGVRIGHGAIIGANSVVTRDVPPYTISAGSPARVVRHRHPNRAKADGHPVGTIVPLEGDR